MTLVILTALLVYLVQIFIGPTLFFAGGPLSERIGLALGSRDTELPMSVHALRARRAVANMQENLILFLPLALLAVISGLGADGSAVLWGWVFVAARALYAITYVLGLNPWRTLFYIAGLVSVLALGLILLQSA